MQQTVTAKLQILVNPSDRQILCDTMKAYSDACNYVSEYIYKTHDLSRYSVQKDTYYQIREIFGLRSQMAISCIRTVIAKYKTLLTETDSDPAVQCVDREYSLIPITDNSLRFATLGGDYPRLDFHQLELCHARHTKGMPSSESIPSC